MVEVVEKQGLRVKSVDEPGLKDGEKFGGQVTSPLNATTVAVLAIDDATAQEPFCFVIVKGNARVLKKECKSVPVPFKAEKSRALLFVQRCLQLCVPVALQKVDVV